MTLDMEILVAIAFYLSGFVAATIAYGKGRSIFWWLVIGTVLGPLGIILVLVVSKNEDSGVQKRCPHCGEWVKEEAIKCRFCEARQ